jgi:hypothetical protein
MVRTLTVAMGARNRVRRVAAEQVEWWEDLLAEAQSRFATAVKTKRPADAETPLVPPTALRPDQGGKAA